MINKSVHEKDKFAPIWKKLKSDHLFIRSGGRWIHSSVVVQDRFAVNPNAIDGQSTCFLHHIWGHVLWCYLWMQKSKQRIKSTAPIRFICSEEKTGIEYKLKRADYHLSLSISFVIRIWQRAGHEFDGHYHKSIIFSIYWKMKMRFLYKSPILIGFLQTLFSRISAAPKRVLISAVLKPTLIHSIENLWKTGKPYKKLVSNRFHFFFLEVAVNLWHILCCRIETSMNSLQFACCK